MGVVRPRPFSLEAVVMIRTRCPALAAALGVALFALAASLTAEPAKKTTHEQEWNRTVDKAVAYCKNTQAADGSWSGNKNPGVTGVVLTGLLQTGKVNAKD